MVNNVYMPLVFLVGKFNEYPARSVYFLGHIKAIRSWYIYLSWPYKSTQKLEYIPVLAIYNHSEAGIYAFLGEISFSSPTRNILEVSKSLVK